MTSANVFLGGIDLDWLSALAAPGVEWTLKAVLILAFASLVARSLHRASAATRHLVWLSSLVAVLAVPVIQVSLPWQWNLAPVVTEEIAGLIAPTNGVESGVAAAPATTPAQDPPAATSSRRDGVGGGSVGSSTPAYGPVESSGILTSFADHPGLILLLIWVAGSALALLVLVRGRFRLARVRRSAEPPDAPGWNERVRRLARSAGLDEAIPVLESSEVKIPLTAGILRREILLPAGAASGWSARRLEAVLLHELAHVRRRDVLSHLLGRVICAVQWFNPLVWFASRRLTRECERACDDHVVLSGTRPSEYAEHLLAFAREGGSGGGLAPALSMARKSDFEGRILALLDPDRPRGPVGRTVALATVAVVAATALLLSVPSARGGNPDDPTGETVAASVLDEAESTDEVRASLRESLADARSEAQTTSSVLGETLLGLLDDSHPRVRAAAARTLGDRREAQATPALVLALEDEDAEVREEAASALGQIGDPGVVDALARLVVDDPDEDVRQSAAWALGETESPQAVTRLSEALEVVRDDRLRHDLIEALGETRQPAAVEVLSGLLVEARGRTQRQALEALVELDSEAALNVLINAMQSEDVYLRRAAAEALSGG